MAICRSQLLLLPWQGTASVVVAGVIASLGLSGRQRLSDHTFLFYGAGEAGVGIADLLVTALLKEDPNMTLPAARQKVWLVDSKGLITSSRGTMEHHKQPYAHASSASPTTLMDAIKLVNPTALFGLSTQGQSFTKAICQEMVSISKTGPGGKEKKPLIFALSNPTSKVRCSRPFFM